MNLELLKRNAVPTEDWNAFCDMHPRAWWWHRSEFVDYALAYTPSATDRSQVVVDKDTGQLIGLIPAAAASGRVAYGGRHIPEALVLPSLEHTLMHGSANLEAAIEFAPGQPVTGSLHPKYMAMRLRTRVLDLRADEATLWRDVRRSYHALIHKAERQFAFDSWGNLQNRDDAIALMSNCLTVHTESSGRQTRPTESWAHQAKWLCSAHGLATTATRPNGTLAGFAYFVRYKQWAYYFSSAAPGGNIAHALIWQAIKTLRCDGATQYLELGIVDERNSPKQKGIAFFKAGFGGTDWNVHRAEAVYG